MQTNAHRSSLFAFRFSLFPLFALLTVILLTNCTTRSFRFADKPPVWEMNDRQPVPMPKQTKYIRMDYYYKVLVRRPAVKVFDHAPAGRSKDVNSYDHVPASSWFTPRLGYKNISPEDLLKASTVVGPPEMPVRVVRAKTEGANPGFVIADSRDHLYLVKFDPPGHPGLETTTALICNRLFWGFGYNVPEDYTFYFNSNQVPIDSTANITDEAVKTVFSSIATPDSGVYRATVSLLLDGVYLGPINDSGVRKDDPNDKFPHEDLRALRGLKVFGALTNQTDIRIDNSLDVYRGFDGEGYVEHYLLDFGEAMGTRGARSKRLWDGFSHIFSFGEMLGNIPALGLKTARWERIQPTPWRSVGVFEAAYFDPVGWKETYPFKPIRRAQADDTYWAAKIVAALNRDHLEKLAAAANYPEPGAAEYIVETLLQRRQKIIDAYFQMVSPLEFVSIDKNRLVLEDYGRKYMSNISGESRYQIRFFNDASKEVAPEQMLTADSLTFAMNLDETVLQKAEDYLRIEIRVWRGQMPALRWAEFHIRADKGKNPRLVGIVH